MTPIGHPHLYHLPQILVSIAVSVNPLYRRLVLGKTPVWYFRPDRRTPEDRPTYGGL